MAEGSAARQQSAAPLDGTKRRPAPSMRGAVLLLVLLACQPAAAQEPSLEQKQSIPEWASEAFQSTEFARDYLLSARVNPFLLNGDFNGDGRLDIAILISRRDTGADGIALLHAGVARPIVVGAGHSIGNGGPNLAGMGAWSVYSKGPVQRGADETAPPRLRGDALLVEWVGSASAIIYWDGRTYRWYQQGD